MILLHRDRYSTSGVVTRKAGVVIHDNEGPDGSSQALIAFLQRPGDRPLAGSNPPRRYGSGYHAVATPDGYVQMADATCGPYHAPPVNKTWLSICLPGYARQTRDEWLDEISRAVIRGAARYIVDQHRIHRFALERRGPGELRAGLGGITDHDSVSKAWGQTDHWDPGPQFPWDVLLADVGQLLAPLPSPNPPIPPVSPPVEDDVPKLIQPFDGFQPDAAVFVLSGHVATWLPTGAHVEAQKARGATCEPGGNPWPIARAELANFVLAGPPPVYDASTPGGRTVAAHFLAAA